MLTQGHSGFSASYVLGVMNKLGRYENLTPLTGNADEWTEIREGLFQNKRCSAVFMENGVAYYLNRYVFEDKYGRYTSNLSRRTIAFPFMPRTEYIKVGSLKYIGFRINKFFGFI